MSTETYSKIIYSADYKQIRMTISEFREVEYLHFREYYLDFDEEWKPTDKGVHIPLELDTSRELFRGMSEILSLAENKQVLEEYFYEIIQEIYLK
jgi:hypothetical protein